MEQDIEGQIRKVEKVLGEPVFIGFDDKTAKIRTSLFLLSVVGLGYALGDLHIQEGSSFLGLKFTGLDDNLFRMGLLVTITYLLVHLLWNSYDSFMEWRVRISGTRLAFQTASYFGNTNKDSPQDARQSSLYHWWIGQSHILGKVEERFKLAELKTDEIAQNSDSYQSRPDPHDREELVRIQKLLKSVTDQSDQLKSALEELKKIYDSKRIVVSLKRFDNWFKLFLQSQNIRWILIEFSLPALLGLSAIPLLWP